jgi:hypothetical protein
VALLSLFTFQQGCEITVAATKGHGSGGRSCKRGAGQGESDLVLETTDLVLQVIAAQGEQKARAALKAASEIISCSQSALQLRYLKTLNTISAEKNSTIIFPVPMDIINYVARRAAK